MESIIIPVLLSGIILIGLGIGCILESKKTKIFDDTLNKLQLKNQIEEQININLQFTRKCNALMGYGVTVLVIGILLVMSPLLAKLNL